MRIIWLVLICALTGCASRPAHDPQQAVSRVVTLPGVQLAVPTDSRWGQSSSQDGVVFTRVTPQADARLSVQVLPADASGDELSFLRAAEARQEAAVRALQMVSVHYNRARLNEALCLQYDGIYRDSLTADPAQQFLLLKGYVCRPPAAARRMVQMELTVRSAARATPEVETLLREADGFFRSAVFQ